MGPTEQIALVYGIGGTVFLAGFLVAVITTGARVIWYIRHHEPRPRLLDRDVVVKSGMFVSFGLIAAIRFLPPDQRAAVTQGNVGWALITTIPAVVAILTYVAYEIWVIPRVTG